MNIRRGLFRLWILGSAMFAGGIAVLNYSDIISRFNDAALTKALVEETDKSNVYLPVLCGQARGEAGVDYTTGEHSSPGPWDKYANPNAFDTCWFTAKRYRALYPEVQGKSLEELAQTLYRENGRPLRDVRDPWHTLAEVASVAVGVPLAVLALGAAFGWALSGFSGQSKVRG